MCRRQERAKDVSLSTYSLNLQHLTKTYFNTRKMEKQIIQCFGFTPTQPPKNITTVTPQKTKEKKNPHHFGYQYICASSLFVLLLYHSVN